MSDVPTLLWVRYRRYAYAIGALALLGLWLTGCDMPNW